MSAGGNSREVCEATPDDRVRPIVMRHLRTVYRKPIQPHNQIAFEWLQDTLGPDPRLVVDAGCGTGVSTERLAARHDGGWIVGVDKSAARLARGVGYDPDRVGLKRDRCVWIRTDLIDFWRLSMAAGWRFTHQYLLYPNPWPKPTHLTRRWHGHPVFPTLIALSRELTLRTNWRTYAVEVGHALDAMGRAHTLRAHVPDGLTPFEAKYAASGHRITELRMSPRARDA